MSFERITITIKKDVLKKIDKTIDRNEIRNRSHAIENLLLKSLNKTDLNTAVILAGGEGTRMRPITYEIPKPLIPIHGIPIMEHQINMLKKYDIRNIIIISGKHTEKLREYFGNGNKFGVRLNYITEEKPLGSAGPLSLVKDMIKDTFILLNVDTLMDPNIPEMYNFHRKHGSAATVMLVTVDNPSAYGVVRMLGNNITGFYEKPKDAVTNLVNAGLCIFEPSVLKNIPERKFMIKDLFKVLTEKGSLFGFVHDGLVFDVGSAEGYEQALKNWKDIKA
jgi:NDP-sugar pyrophosphorylase family protein